VDRASEIEKLEQYLLPRIQQNRRKIVALYGLGGIGKTQLSIEFARRHQFQFSAVFWLDGRSEDKLKLGIAALASRIPEGQIPESSRTYSPHNTSAIDAVIRDVFNWLNAPENNNWLIVLDNVDHDYQDLQADPDAYDVR
jgi:Cdc6-like AAA superfamily ATPase